MTIAYLASRDTLPGDPLRRADAFEYDQMIDAQFHSGWTSRIRPGPPDACIWRGSDLISSSGQAGSGEGIPSPSARSV